jgi:2-keto-3-deoxy-L-rhamnonate aldolase RhmA
LHAALGLMPQNDSAEPAFLAALDKVINACAKHGKTAGTLCMTVEAAHKRLAHGFRFVGVGNDVSLLAAGARSMLAAVAAG